MKINVVKKSFQSGEVSPEIEGRSDSQIYQSAVSRMENFIPTPQGGARFRTSIKAIADATPSSNLVIPFDNTDGTSNLFVYEGDYFQSYTRFGRVEKQADAPYTPNVVGFTYNYFDSSTNTWRISFGSDPGIVPNDFIEAKVTVKDSVSGIESEYVIRGYSSNIDTAATPKFIEIIDNDASFANNSTIESVESLLKLEGINIPGTSNLDPDKINYIQIGAELYISSPEVEDVWVFDGNFSFAGVSFTPTGFTFPTGMAFYEQRLVLSKDNKFGMSETNNFDNFTTGTGSTDPVSYTLAGSNNNVSTINWIKETEKFLLLGTASGNFVVTGGGEYQPITATSITATPIDSLGSKPIDPINSDSKVYFVERGGRNLRALEFDYRIRGYKSLDLNKASKHITRGSIKRLVFYQKEPNLVVALLEDGSLRGLIVDDEAQTVGWFRIASDLEFLDIKEGFDGFSGSRLYALTKSGTNVSLDYLEEFVEYPQLEDFFTGDEAIDLTAYREAKKALQDNDFYMDSKIEFKPFFEGSLVVSSNASFSNRILTTTNETLKAGDVIQKEGGINTITIDSLFSHEGDGVFKYNVTTSFNDGEISDIEDYFVTRSVFNFEKFKNKSIWIASEGKSRSIDVDSSGDIAFNALERDSKFSSVYFGFKYVGMIKTLPLEAATQLGDSSFKKKNLSHLFIKLLNAFGFKYGTDLYNLKTLNLRRVSDPIDDNVPLLTGVTEPLSINDDWEREKSVYFVQDKPYPLNITSYGYYVKAEES